MNNTATSIIEEYLNYCKTQKRLDHKIQISNLSPYLISNPLLDILMKISNLKQPRENWLL